MKVDVLVNVSGKLDHHLAKVADLGKVDEVDHELVLQSPGLTAKVVLLTSEVTSRRGQEGRGGRAPGGVSHRLGGDGGRGRVGRGGGVRRRVVRGGRGGVPGRS